MTAEPGSVVVRNGWPAVPSPLSRACTRARVEEPEPAATGDGAEATESRSDSGGKGAGHEGGVGGGSVPASATYLTSGGISRGVFSSPELQAHDYYADKLNDLEFALAYDSASGSFLGRIKNETNEGLCDAKIKVIVAGGS